MIVSSLPPSPAYQVHVDKKYVDAVRHLRIFSKVNSSTSGQFDSQNLDLLVQKIREVFKDNIIYFIDTRDDRHFELNNLAVSKPFLIREGDSIGDDDRTLASEQLENEEEEWVEKLLKQYVRFEGRHIQVKTSFIASLVEWVIDLCRCEHRTKSHDAVVTSSATVWQFIEDEKYQNQHVYLRLAVDGKGPLEDEQVDTYLSLLDQNQSAWFHFNAKIGGVTEAPMFLVIIKDILENAPTQSFNEILEPYTQMGKNQSGASYKNPPKGHSEKDLQLQKRAHFLRNFYTYAKTREDHGLNWSDWKKENIKD
jgi:hypothetical protein